MGNVINMTGGVWYPNGDNIEYPNNKNKNKFLPFTSLSDNIVKLLGQEEYQEVIFSLEKCPEILSSTEKKRNISSIPDTPIFLVSPLEPSQNNNYAHIFTNGVYLLAPENCQLYFAGSFFEKIPSAIPGHPPQTFFHPGINVTEKMDLSAISFINTTNITKLFQANNAKIILLPNTFSGYKINSLNYAFNAFNLKEIDLSCLNLRYFNDKLKIFNINTSHAPQLTKIICSSEYDKNRIKIDSAIPDNIIMEVKK